MMQKVAVYLVLVSPAPLIVIAPKMQCATHVVTTPVTVYKDLERKEMPVWILTSASSGLALVGFIVCVIITMEDITVLAVKGSLVHHRPYPVLITLGSW